MSKPTLKDLVTEYIAKTNTTASVKAPANWKHFALQFPALTESLPDTARWGFRDFYSVIFNESCAKCGDKKLFEWVYEACLAIRDDTAIPPWGVECCPEE